MARIALKCEINTLVGYADRNFGKIPCYALRKALPLRNSSNLGEKTNDHIVSNRQKKKGLGWSINSSSSLATIATIFKNNHSNEWIKNIPLQFIEKKVS